MLDVERLQAYIPIILMFTAVSLCILVWKFITMSWNKPLAVVNAVYNLGLCVLLYAMLNDVSLLNDEFVSNTANLSKLPSAMMTQWNVSKMAFALVFIAICVWDSIAGFVKSER